MKLGVLYPRSGEHPNMMADFVEGVKTALQQWQLTNNIQLITESIGFGGNEKEVYEKAEKLIVLEDVDILIAYIDLRVTALLEPLLYASGKLMIIVNPGANYPQNWIPQPGILYLTLEHGFLCWLSGQLAGLQKNAKAAMATSFYDGGYLHGAAMVKSFVKKGGSITYNYVDNRPGKKDILDIKNLTSFLAADKDTNQLLCLFDSAPAAEFYHELNKENISQGLQLYVSPMMLDENTLRELGKGFSFSIEGYLPWRSSLENKANHEFNEIYEKQTKRKTSIFSLLGWETGMIIRDIFINCTAHYREGEEIVASLSGKIIDSPRGELKLDTQTNYFTGPVYKCSIPARSAVLEIEKIEDSGKDWRDFTNEPMEGISSGWTNTYLCY